MHPILFDIGGFKIPSYGAFLVASFLLAHFLLKKEAAVRKMPADKVGEVAIAGLLFGLVGAKLLLILIDLPEYLADPKSLLNTIRSAGVIYGGLIGGAAGVVWSIHRHKLPAWETLDTMAPFAALGVGLGRLSCLMVGCCHGFAYDGPLALVFPDVPYCEAPPGIGLFPVQIVGLINGILLFLLLRYLLRHRYVFRGQIIISFLFLYSLTRGLIEFLRGDTVRGLWLGGVISTSQLIGLIGIVVAVILYLRQKKERVA